MKVSPLFLVLTLFAICGCSVSTSLETAPSSTMTANLSSEMQKVVEANQPGIEHRMLAPLQGRWRAAVRTWSVPGSDPESTDGMATIEWVLGGRFLREEFKGVASGLPFHGLSLIGYDRGRRSYVSTWADSISTAINWSEGRYDDARNIFTFNGKMTNPISGKIETTRSELRILTPERFTFQQFELDPNGREYRTLEVVYSRES